MPITMQAPTYDEIGRWLEIATAGEKRAGTKKRASEMETSGGGKSDPGGYDGPSSHPSARPASNLQSAPMGARAKENEEDNKEDRGPASVDSTSAEGGGDQDDKQMHVGMNPSATGDDPSVEDDYKGDKEDGTTAHPADAEDVGEKYSSWRLDKLCKQAEALQNNILASITMGFGFEDAEPQPKKAAASKQPAAPAKKPAVKQATAPASAPTVEAGYEIAAAMGLSKQAADANVNNFLAGILKEASDDADRVGACLAGYYNQLKRAEEGEAHEKKESPAEEAAEKGGEESGGVPPEILAAASGAGGPEGGPPGGGLGAPGPEMGGGGGGGDDNLQQLVMALVEAGIPPEKLPELIAAVQGAEQGGEAGGGGGGGGLPMMPPEAAGAGPGAMPPGGDAMPPGGAAPPPGPAEMGAKIASAAIAYQKSGKFRYTEAKQGSEQRRKRDLMKNYILEIAGLS